MERPRIVRWLILLAVALGCVTVAVNVLLDPFDPADDKATQRYLASFGANVGCTLLAVLALAHGARASGPLRPALVLMSIGLLGYNLGNWVWLHANLTGTDVPYPSLADVGYLSLPLLSIVGALVLLRGDKRRTQGIDLAIGLVFPLTTLFVFYAVLIQPRYDAGADGLRTLVDLAYPTGDAAYIALAGLLLYFTRPTAITASVRRLSAAMVLVAVTDVIWIAGMDRGFYFTGSWIDILYVFASFGFGLALLRFPAHPTNSGTISREAAPAAG